MNEIAKAELWLGSTTKQAQLGDSPAQRDKKARSKECAFCLDKCPRLCYYAWLFATVSKINFGLLLAQLMKDSMGSSPKTTRRGGDRIVPTGRIVISESRNGHFPDLPKGRSFRDHTTIVIGRSPGAHLRISDRFTGVSRIHCFFRRNVDEKTWTLWVGNNEVVCNGHAVTTSITIEPNAIYFLTLGEAGRRYHLRVRLEMMPAR